MAGKSAILSVRIVSDVENAVKGMERVSNKTSLLDKAIMGATAVFATGSAASLAYGVSAVQAAGELEQSQGAIESVFKDSAASMLAFSDNAATAVGLTKNEYNEMATLIGAQLKNTGTSMEELGPKTNDLISLGADLSSMFGGTTADAVGALSSALKGEMDPIERYGISLNDATLTAKGLEMGIEKVNGAFTAEQKAAITMAAIMDQSADAHGNFAKESDTLAHKQQVFAAQLGNVKTTIGEHLLPVASQFFSFLVDTAGPALQSFSGNIPGMVTSAQSALTGLGNWFVENQGTITAVATVLAVVLGPALLRLAATTLYAQGVKVAAWTVIQAKAVWAGATYVAQSAIMVAKWIWMGAVSMANAARMAAAWFIALGPIGWAIAAIIAVVAVVVANWDTIKTWTINTWNAVSDWTVETWNKVTAWISQKVEAAKTWVSNAWSAIVGFTRTAFENAKAAVFTAMVNLVLAVISKGEEVMSFFRNLPGKIKGALAGAATWLVSVGGDMMRGLINGIKNKAGAIADAAKNAVSGAVDKVKGFLGIKSPSRLMRDEVGSMIAEGTAVGIGRRARAVQGAAVDMTKRAFSAVKSAATRKPMEIASKVRLSTSAAHSAHDAYKASTASQSAAPVININLNGVIGDRIGIATEIERLLREKNIIVGGAA